MLSLPPQKARLLVVFAFLAFAAVSCEDSTGPRMGYARLFVQTTGGDPDNLFEITSDTVKLAFAANTIATLQLPAGQRSFELKGVADNCIVDGGNIASVEIPKNDTALVIFKVGCAETGLFIETRTTGREFPLRFEISIPSLPSVFIPPNEKQTYSRLTPGRYQVSVTGGSNCSVPGGSSVAADVVNRQLTTVIFNILCVSAPRDIAFVDGTKIVLMNADGSAQAELITGAHPSWSPDGKKIVYSTTFCDIYTYDCFGSLAIVDPATLQITALTPVGFLPAWSPTGDVIAYNDARTARLYLFILATGTTTPLTLPQGVVAENVSWSPDGTQLVASCSSAGIAARLCIINRDGSGIKYLDTGTVPNYWGPSWSPDGKQIAFTTVPNPSMISVIAPDGSGLRNLTPGGSPSWSPDGKQIIFGTSTGLFRINDDGSSLTRLTTGNHYSAVWRLR